MDLGMHHCNGQTGHIVGTLQQKSLVVMQIPSERKDVVHPSLLICHPFLFLGGFSFGRGIGWRRSRGSTRRWGWNCHHWPKATSCLQISKSSPCIQVRCIHFFVFFIRKGIIMLFIVGSIIPRLIFLPVKFISEVIVKEVILFSRIGLFRVVLIVILDCCLIDCTVCWMTPATAPSWSSGWGTLTSEATWWLICGSPVVLSKQQKHRFFYLCFFHRCSNMCLDQLTLFHNESSTTQHQPWDFHSKLLNLPEVFPVLSGVGEQSLGSLTMKAVEKLRKGSRHLHLLVILEAGIKHL